MNYKIDKENMFESIWEFADNLEDAYSIGDKILLLR